MKGTDGWTSDNEAVSVEGNNATVSEAAAPAGATITAVYADKAGNAVDPVSDTVATATPEVSVNPEDKIITTWDVGGQNNAIDGTAQNASKVLLVDPVTESTVTEANVEANGQYSIDISNITQDASYTTDEPKHYKVYAENADGTRSEGQEVIADKTAIPVGTKLDISPANDLDGIKYDRKKDSYYYKVTQDEIPEGSQYIPVKVALPKGTQIGDIVSGTYGFGDERFDAHKFGNGGSDATHTVTKEDLENGYVVFNNAVPVPSADSTTAQVRVSIKEPYAAENVPADRGWSQQFIITPNEKDSSHINVVLAKDTEGGDYGTANDGVTKDGTLKFLKADGTEVPADQITSVTVNGKPIEKSGNVWKLPEGEYDASSIVAKGASVSGRNDARMEVKAGAEPDALLAHDTGSSASDAISNDGRLAFADDSGAPIDPAKISSVTVNGKPLEKDAETGSYKLPEGKYEAGAISFETTDGVTGQNAQAITVDTTAPTAAPVIERATAEGTKVELPADAEVGAQVVITAGKTTATLTKGADGWTSDHPEIAAVTDDGAKANIPLTVAGAGATVTAKQLDAAGNESPIASKSVIDPSKISIVLADGVNFNTDNDKADHVVLNLEEMSKAAPANETRDELSTVPVRVYFPEGTQVDDAVTIVIKGARTTTMPTKVRADWLKDGLLVKAMGVSVGEGSVDVSITSGSNQGQTTTFKFEVDKDMPQAPVVSASEDGTVTVTLPTKNESYTDGTAAKQANVQVDDFVTITDGDFTAKITKTADGWSSDNPQVTVSGNTATIEKGVLAAGTTVTAQAEDNVGNKSAASTAKVGGTTTGEQTQPDVTEPEVTEPDNTRLHLNDNAETPIEITPDHRSLILDFNKPITFSNPADVINDSKVTMTFTDGKPASRVITDAETGKPAAKVYNILNDWDMRRDDDFNRRDDHAEGWGLDSAAAAEDAKLRGDVNQKNDQFFRWDGDNTLGDYIIVADRQVDDDAWTSKRGNIGTEASKTSDPRFVMDTHGGGDDVIVAAGGITGNARIITNDGDDFINAVFMSGISHPTGYFNGSAQIFMGSGNDHFELYGKASDREVKYGDYRDAGMYYTNAKIDMGSGNDIIEIKNDVIADAETASGNYFNLGSDNDKFIVGGDMLSRGGTGASEASNIVNLGSGNDEFKVRDLGQNDREALVLSEDGSKINARAVQGHTSFMLGDGKDEVSVDVVSIQNTRTSWLNEAFNKSDQFSQTNAWYRNFYDDELKDTINRKLAATDEKVGKGVLGTDHLSNGGDPLAFDARFDFGDGENKLNVSGSTTNLNCVGGADSDTVYVGDATYNSKFWMGEGTNNLTVEKNYNDGGYSGGAGNDTVVINGSASGSFNLGSGTNSLTVKGNSNHVKYNGVDGADSKTTLNLWSVEGGTYNFGGNGATTIVNVGGDAFDSAVFNLGSGSTTTNELHIRGNVNSNVAINATNANDYVDIAGSFATGDRETTRVDLGEGNNHLRIGSATRGLRYTSGSGNDQVEIGIGEPNGTAGNGKVHFDSDGINQSAGMYDNEFKLGASNDTITIARISDAGLDLWGAPRNAEVGVRVYGDEGNDTINIHGIATKYVQIYGGDDDDKINLWGAVAESDNTIEIKGGTGYDTLEIGTSGDDNHARFTLGEGKEKSGYVELQNIEHVIFNSENANSGDTIYVFDDSITGHSGHAVKITAKSDAAAKVNTVDINGDWHQGTTRGGNEPGQSYTYENGIKYFTYTSSNSDDWLLIDSRIVDAGMVK